MKAVDKLKQLVKRECLINEHSSRSPMYSFQPINTWGLARD